MMAELLARALCLQGRVWGGRGEGVSVFGLLKGMVCAVLHAGPGRRSAVDPGCVCVSVGNVV